MITIPAQMLDCYHETDSARSTFEDVSMRGSKISRRQCHRTIIPADPFIELCEAVAPFRPNDST